MSRSNWSRGALTLVLSLGGLLVGCDAESPPPASGTDAGRATGSDAGPVAMGHDAGRADSDAGRAMGPDAAVPAGATTPPPGAVEMLAGSFAMQTRFATIQTLPFLGDQRSVARALALVTIAEEGGVLRFTERGCHVEIEGGGGSAMTDIPDAIPRSIPASVTTLEFREMGGTWHWTRPMVEVPVGWRASGAGEALPMNAMDARVFDQDGDSNPGVTVHVSGLATGDVYVVQRQRAWYTGALALTADELRGDNHSEGSEQRTIGASTMLLNTDIPSRDDPDRRDDTVRIRRIEPSYDCDRVVSQAATLFP